MIDKLLKSRKDKKSDCCKMDVCRLRLEDNWVIVWVNDMRPQHTNGSVIAWITLPACS